MALLHGQTGAALTASAELTERPRLEGPPRPGCDATGFAAVWAVLVLGVLYGVVSAYWGLGGHWLLETVGGSLEQQARAGTAIVKVAVWVAVILKLVAAVLPLFVLRRLVSTAWWDRALWVLVWAEAAILTIYGLVLTTTGLLVQAGVIRVSPSADHRALAWHAYLWDPWFLVWGLLVTTALLRSRPRRLHHTSAR